MQLVFITVDMNRNENKKKFMMMDLYDFDLCFQAHFKLSKLIFLTKD